MKEEGFRAFVAIEIPDAIRAQCAGLSATLGAGARHVTWVKPGNLHLTLKFLGNARAAQAKRLLESLRHKARKLSPFEVALAGLGAFPSLRRPRVIWVGVTEGADALRDLAAKVEGAAAKAGFPRESRAFSPHLTLGRVKMAGKGESLQALLARSDPGPLGRFPVGEVVLFQSRLSPGGAVHTPLHRVALGRETGPEPPAEGA
jgi:2'-5' RNA ligase